MGYIIDNRCAGTVRLVLDDSGSKVGYIGTAEDINKSFSSTCLSFPFTCFDGDWCFVQFWRWPFEVALVTATEHTEDEIKHFVDEHWLLIQAGYREDIVKM